VAVDCLQILSKSTSKYKGAIMRKPILLLLAVVLVAVPQVYAKDPIKEYYEEIAKQEHEYGKYKQKWGCLTGKVEIFPGVPCKDCYVSLLGYPARVKCSSAGFFTLNKIPSGWGHFSASDGKVTMLWFSAAVQPLQDTSVGTILLPTGTVAGRIVGVDAWNLAKMVVTVEGIPVATKPDAYGNYLLTNVPMGQRQIVLHGIWWDKSEPVRKMQINIPKNQHTNAPDFVLKPPPPPAQLQQPPQPPGHMGPEPRPLPPAKVEPSPSMPATSPQSSGRGAAPPRPEQEARPLSTKLGYCCLQGQVTYIPLEECERKAGSIFPTLEEAKRNCNGGGRRQ
jgi:hypothetical protein